MQIRNENRQDWPAVDALLRAAFPTDAEALLVARLRRAASPLLSLVAADGDEIIAHILFTPVTLNGAKTLLMGLAPMAVLPERQHQGIGSALVNAGLQQCKLLKASTVFVLGHANYYPRFGFHPTAPFGISSEYDVHAENFMMAQLDNEQGELPHGIIRFHPEFNSM